MNAIRATLHKANNPDFMEGLGASRPAFIESLDRFRSGYKKMPMTAWLDFPMNQGRALSAKISGEASPDKLPEYDCVVNIGIGGSFLGAKAIIDFLRATRKTTAFGGSLKPIHFWGNHCCPFEMQSNLMEVENTKPLFVAVSKTGGTLETNIGLRVALDWLQKKFGKKDALDRVIVVTDKKSGVLREFAAAEKILNYEVPDGIGGRFSCMSAGTLAPLMLAGVDILALSEGFAEVFTKFLNAEEEIVNLIASYGNFRDYSHRSAGKDIEVLAYGLSNLGSAMQWNAQLYGESQGKSKKGIFPIPIYYSRDLHSLGQAIQDGKRNLIETLVRIENIDSALKIPMNAFFDDGKAVLDGMLHSDLNRAFNDAAAFAHAEGDVPVMEIIIDDVSERSIASYLAMNMLVCAVGGLALGVNPFDQPGVDNYKNNLQKILLANSL